MEKVLEAQGGRPEGRLSHAGEADLVRACAAGTPEAFRELLARHRQAAFSLAFQMLGNAEDAEDIAQEAFVRVFQSIGGFRGQAAFSTWLYRIVTNLCLGRLRRRRPCVPLEACPEVAGAKESSREVAETLLTRQVLAQLKPELRVVLLLREQGTLSYEEIGLALQLPLATVRSRLSKARAAFREIWKRSLQCREGSP